MKNLEDLVSVGPATLKDFKTLGIKTISQLAKQNPRLLYLKLCRLTNASHDPCVEDVFAAAIAQAKDPSLPEEQKKWAYWSRLRKQRISRCEWVPIGNTPYEKYHDEEWGVPVHDDRRHFEFLILEGAQAGLSWETILKRRKGYAKAFANFDWEKVARYNETHITKLLQDPGIIRHRGKIEAAIHNAKLFSAIRKEFGSFDTYVWAFVGGKPLSSGSDTPKKLPAAKTLCHDLKKRGFRFVGLSIVYAYMQAVGLINDHSTACFKRS